MRELLLFRHAKSSWAANAKSDHARRLSPRGIKAGLRMGHWLATEELIPDRVISSTAKRTRETLKLATQLWDAPPKVRFEPELYLADVPALLQAIMAHGGRSQRLMVLAHNPGLLELTVELSNGKSREIRDTVGKFPTGAIAHLRCDIDDWSQLQPNCATLETYMRPRALT